MASKNIDGIVSIVNKCLQEGFIKTSMLNPSISEYQLYKWCRKYRRPDTDIINRRTRLIRQSEIAGESSPFSQPAYNLELEILQYDITTFISLLKLDYYFMHRDCHDMEESDIIFYTEVKAIDEFIRRYGTSQQKKQKFARRYPLSLFDNFYANQSYRLALFAAVNASILFELGKIDLARNDMDFAIQKHKDVSSYVDIDKILESFKNYHGGLSAGKIKHIKSKKDATYEKSLIEDILKAIAEIDKNPLPKKPRDIAAAIVEKMGIQDLNTKILDKTGDFNIASRLGVIGYITSNLVDNGQFFTAYQNKKLI